VSGRPENQTLPPPPDGDAWQVVTHQFAITTNLLCAHGEVMPLASTTWSWDVADGIEVQRLPAPFRWFIRRRWRRRLEEKAVKFIHVRVSREGRHWGDRVTAPNDAILKAVVADLKGAQTRAFRAAQE
jgi:hypothetical protein